MRGLRQAPVVAVGVDGSAQSIHALHWAAGYASVAGGSLRVIVGWEMPTLFGRPVPHEGYEPVTHAHEVLNRAVADVRLPSDRVEGLFPVGRPGASLVDLSSDANLLVVGRRGHTATSHLLLGSTSDYCAHHAHPPVVVISEAAQVAMATAASRPIVVVGVDGSRGSTSALHWAADYVRAREGVLHVVTVWEWPVAYGYPAIPPGYSPESDAKLLLARAVEEISLPADQIEAQVVEGSAGPELIRMSEGANLLVVGGQGHSQLSSVLLGSVSRYCVHHSTVPTVITRSD